MSGVCFVLFSFLSFFLLFPFVCLLVCAFACLVCLFVLGGGGDLCSPYFFSVVLI